MGFRRDYLFKAALSLSGMTYQQYANQNGISTSTLYRVLHGASHNEAIERQIILFIQNLLAPQLVELFKSDTIPSSKINLGEGRLLGVPNSDLMRSHPCKQLRTYSEVKINIDRAGEQRQSLWEPGEVE